MGYGVIGSPTDSGSVSLGSSPGTPAQPVPQGRWCWTSGKSSASSFQRERSNEVLAPSSSGLGRRPLKAVARVRIPSGLQRFRERSSSSDGPRAVSGLLARPGCAERSPGWRGGGHQRCRARRLCGVLHPAGLRRPAPVVPACEPCLRLSDRPSGRPAAGRLRAWALASGGRRRTTGRGGCRCRRRWRSADARRWRTSATWSNCHLHFDHCGGNPLLAGAAGRSPSAPSWPPPGGRPTTRCRS